ncbi:MAG TPA: TOMM precursor leader peptide-binding protein [Natronosporangium sp.]
MTRDFPSTPTPPGPLPRPTLVPGLRRIWRGRCSLQLGVDPARAVVLELPDPRAAQVLDLLDGTRSERTVITEAERLGVPEPTTRSLLAALRQAGLVLGAQSLLPHNLPEPIRRRLADEAAALALRGADAPGTPAQILRRRAAAKVVVAGDGRLLTPVAVALAESGVGHVAPATEAAAEAIRRAAPGTATAPLRRSETTFAVHVGALGPANLIAAGYARYRVPHLLVAIRDGTALIGPLVPPRGQPCLNCLDLHRRDRDPAWPRLAAELAAAGDEPCATTTRLAAAGLAAAEVLSWLDGGEPATLGALVELAAPGQLRRRSWPPHPRCDCARASARRTGRMIG